MQIASALLVGLVFGIGLLVSGMTDPFKVIGFLDLFGQWDPSLAFVMAGAVVVGLVAFRLARRLPGPALGGVMRLPEVRGVDRRLVAGSLVFGVGWGLAGFCPGPAVVALGAGYDKAAVFVGAMVLGMALYELFERRRRLAAGLADG